MIISREILDSNNNPTLEVELKNDSGVFRSAVPSGISTGKYEAAAVTARKAIKNIEKIIAPVLEREDISNQKRIDEILTNLDGTRDKSRLGANAILAVSIAVCRAGAKIKSLSLYQYIARMIGGEIASVLPKPSFNMVEGGKHAKSGLAFQEFMVVPQKEKFSDNLKIGKIVYKSLKNYLVNKFDKESVSLSREGAFSPPLTRVSEAFDSILAAVENKDEIKIAIDAAASEFYKNNSYEVDGQIFSAKELADFYSDLVERYPIISIEDPFAQDDENGWREIRFPADNIRKSDFLIFGDDLTVTNLDRIKMAKENNLCNAVIIKPNQIGTVTETIEAAKLAKSYGWKIMVANRAGETMDDFIADLAVGIGADFIKSGAPYPKERMVKYNRLLKIEKELRK